MKKIKFSLFVITVISLILFQSCKKDKTDPDYDILSESTSYEDVQTAIDQAETGNIVKIPEGSSTWTSTLVIPDDKKITIIGSGTGITVISGTEDSPYALIDINASGSRITQIGFLLYNNNGMGISVDGKNWRIDHCKFENKISYTIEGIQAQGDKTCPVGLIDHCEFINIRVVIYGESRMMANSIWNEPLGLGTNNAVFIEDCIFNFTTNNGNAIDSNYGGRYVFRYNKLTDVYIMSHSVQATNRASRSWEIYENTIIQENRSMWAAFFLRGGTGVIFNNTITGNRSSGPSIVIDNVRSFEDVGDGGLCDGTSPWDGNEESNGYPARDQIGRSTDEWLWTESNPYPPQESDPFYQWNNTHNGTNIDVYIHNNCGVHIKENRDYYNNI